jgi:ribosomal protein S18 acetylase RimI-like enzyme
MNRPHCIHDRSILEAHLRQRPLLHLYELGDLDEFFWPYTTWHALRDGNGLAASALVYSGTDLPVLIAMSDDRSGRMRQLLEGILHVLPSRFYAHLTDGLDQVFHADYRIEPHGAHLRMNLAHPEVVARVDGRGAAPLGRADLEAIGGLYGTAYPDNWFDPRMLDTGAYHGIREDGRLVGVAGVHVYSPAYRVAALGNIATDPLHRGRGIGGAVTAAVCRWLLRTTDIIGLNVREDNAAAIRCYERLGFETCAGYGEYLVERTR